MKLKIQHTKFVWDTAKAVLKWKFITLNAYIRKEVKAQDNNLKFHFRI